MENVFFNFIILCVWVGNVDSRMKLRVCEDRVLRGTFGPKSEGVTEGLHSLTEQIFGFQEALYLMYLGHYIKNIPKRVFP